MSLASSNRRRALLACLAALACASLCVRVALAQGLRQVGNDAFGMTIEEVEPSPTGIRVKVLIENLTSSQEIFLHHEPNQLNAQDFFFLPAARRNRGSTRDTFVLRVAPAGTASADVFFPIEPGKNPGLLVLGSRRPPFEQVAVALGPILKGRPPDEVADAPGLVEPLGSAPLPQPATGARPAPRPARPPSAAETVAIAPPPETPPTGMAADRPEAAATVPPRPAAAEATPPPVAETRPAPTAETPSEPPAATPSPDGIIIELAEAPPADPAIQSAPPAPQAPDSAVLQSPARTTLQAPAPATQQPPGSGTSQAPAPMVNRPSAPTASQGQAYAKPKAPGDTPRALTDATPRPPAPTASQGLAYAKPKAPADTPRAPTAATVRPQARPGSHIATVKPPAEPLYTPPGAPPQTRWIPIDDGPAPRPEFTTPPGAPLQTRWIPIDDGPVGERPAVRPGPANQPQSRPAVGPGPESLPKTQDPPRASAPVPPPQAKAQARPPLSAQQPGQPRAAAKPTGPQAPATAQPKPKIVFLPNTPGDRVLQIYSTPHASLGEKLVLRQGRTGRGGYGWSRIRAEHPDVGGPDIAMAATYPHQVWSDGRTLLYLRWSEEQNGAIVLQVAGDLIVNAQWASYDELLYWLGPGRIYPRLLYQGAR